jgi:drug/metabolite transporter (DMT)-like permease
VTADRTRTAGLALFAILAFAANSLLTRRALAGGEIGPGAFVAIRLASGALMLAVLSGRRADRLVPDRADLGGIASLLGYAVAFTFAYVQLGAAVGALILFPTVQLTLLVIAVWRGDVPSAREGTGSALALAGIVCLLAPAARTPSMMAAGLMATAGVSWGFYTSLGRGATDPLARTTRNFLGAAPFVLPLALLQTVHHATALGAGLAIVSGAVSSALGYALWYAVLPRLSASAAGTAQLLVPAITALAGVAWLGERPSIGLVVSSALILSGVAITTGLYPRPRRASG